ncbi:MAG: anti-sigma factor [Gemmatimonadaceae bacterium]|nr:anti-sigma factor [Gemmatimonadaceae bacterium]
MSHEEVFSELAAVALDAVSADVGQAVRAHAAVCPECGPELAAMEETVTMLGELVPSAEMNRGRKAGIRSRLVMRARAERESRSAAPPGPPDLARGVASLTGLGQRITPGSQRVATGETKRVTPAQPVWQIPPTSPASRPMNWLAIAATLALIASGAQQLRVTADRNAMRDQLAAADTLVPRADSFSSALLQKDAMIAAMSGPDVKVVALVNKSAAQPLGKMMWNRASDDWIMVTYNLKPPKPGMTYQVWLVTDSAKISAGTFRPDPQGKTVMHAHYALARNALRAVAITEEPEGGMPAPTGPMVVAGSA